MGDGEYPIDLLQDTLPITDWSFVQPGDLEIIHQPIDFLGVNYYSTATVRMWNGKSAKLTNDGRGEIITADNGDGTITIYFPD